MNRKRHTYVHEWFAEIATQYPDQTAIDTGSECISYRELHARAQSIAAAIAAEGEIVGRPVVVFTDKRADMIAALIGTLTAGAAFVPLTPDLPDARLAEMVAIASPACVLADAALASRYASQVAQAAPAARVLAFDALPGEAAFAAPELDPEHFCYIYFSSGSTGEPKGIAGRLKAIDHFIRWELKTLALEPGTRVSQLIAPTFDAFLRDVFVPLCSGGTICLPPPDHFLEGDALADWLDAARVNLVHCVPSLFRTLFPALDAERFAHLRHVLLSGEAVRPSDVAIWHGNFGTRISLVNLYGPSETTMTKFAYVIAEGDHERRSIPIGKPMPGAMAFLADERGQPTSSVGEICIRTPFRSAGYYRQPELTAQAFVKNPFGTDENDYIYRTGDTGRILEDGNYEFLGRRDGQVKLRGIRIDLGEIENAIIATGLAREAVTSVHEAEHGQTLCAYVILSEGGRAGDLREALRKRLPTSMLPGLVIPLERIPTLPNGKTDRLSLPDPAEYLAARAGAAAEPLNPFEEIIAGVWCKLLRIPSVRREDSFFELGGHSLLAAQATARIGNALDADIPLRLILQAPRLGDLAREVQQLIKDYEDEGTIMPELARADRGAPLPLSFAQQRLWFIDQLEPGNSAYNIPFAVRLVGDLNPAALSASLSEIVRRHEALRTSFPTVEGAPVQLIHEARALDVPLVSLEHLPDGEREGAMRELAAAEAARPFHLAAEESLLRAQLVRMSEREHVLVVVLHHIVSDGWSTGVLVREFGQLYAAYGQGQASPLAELPIQYADYAVWQREWLQGDVLEAQLSYWREQLKDMERLELPTDGARAAAGAGAASVRFEVGEELTESLRELSRREGVTLFMVLTAALQLLLGRYTGQEDVAVGTAVANRGRVEVEPLVGFFVNTLVLRTDLSGEPSFSELLRRVSASALGAYAHQDLPFEKLVEELDPERDLNRNSLFQVAFAFENVPLPSFELAGLEVDSMSVDGGASKFDLTLTISEAGGRLTGGMEYRTDLFARETAERMAAHLLNIFRSIAEDAGRSLSSIEMLSPAEVAQLTSGWNDTATVYPKDSTVNELFARQAALTPDATALERGGELTSYAELNRRANQLGNYLRKLGVGAESKVGVCVERGAELIVSLLGVLKAGGAYVPLDADYPKERNAYMLADAGVSVVITQSRLADSLPEHGLASVLIDDAWGDISAESADDFDGGARADNLAYVIYTSGSTGRPKGVAVSHRSIVRLVKETNYVELDAREVVLQYAPVSFDASTFEVWGSLLNGCRLFIAPPGRLSLRELGEQISAAGVTTLWLTAGLFHQMVEDELESLRGVRQLLAGGDVLRPAQVERVLRELPGVELINGYGPTENTTFTCCHRMRGGRQAVGASVPLGRPISNTQVYVLDENMRPVATGVYGELYAGGDGVARGYANQPALTAEKFVPDPFGAAAGGRLYRTGDIVRWLADGNIEFQGRRDGQLKLRGFRIETGEVEATLCEHEAVGACAVVAREFEHGDRRLVAYVTPRGGELPAEGELRRYVRERLPEYMCPSAFVPLESLPLNANGKIDRAALPDPALPGESEAGYVAPRTPAEETLSAIWSELLGAARVGVRDNFFDLGGHSLLATQLASRARAAFAVDLPLRAIFEHPTLEDLAAVIVTLIDARGEQAGAASPDTITGAPAANDEEVEALLAEIEQLSEEETRMALAPSTADASDSGDAAH